MAYASRGLYNYYHHQQSHFWPIPAGSAITATNSTISSFSQYLRPNLGPFFAQKCFCANFVLKRGFFCMEIEQKKLPPISQTHTSKISLVQCRPAGLYKSTSCNVQIWQSVDLSRCRPAQACTHSNLQAVQTCFTAPRQKSVALPVFTPKLVYFRLLQLPFLTNNHT